MLVALLFYCNKAGAVMPNQSIDEKPVALMNGVAHLGNGEIIENAVITFEQGKIKLVADARLVRLDLSGYEIIDIFGQHVYPIQERSKNKKRKCFNIITETSSRQIAENEPANLLVSANELNAADNSILHVFVNGQAQSKDHFMLKANHLKIK